MKVLLASAEMAPLAKVGGLADVVGSLPKALNALGADARVALPAYAMVENGPWDISTTEHRFPVKINHGWHKDAVVKILTIDGVTVYLIGTDEWFDGADRSETIYRPGVDQYLFFSQAVLQMFRHIGWRPDAVHAHDWHMGLIPLLMKHSPYHQLDDIASVFTIHNQAYQGEFGLDILDRLDLPHWLFQPAYVEAYGHLNFLKTGMVFADRVTTVSPQYAKDIQTPEYGARLDGLMEFLDEQGRLSGILNGIDQAFFDPTSDPELPAAYSAENLAGKDVCRQSLIERAGLDESIDGPVIGIVCRLSAQKGIDLLLEASEELLQLPIRLVVLGAGDPPIVEGLTHLERLHPGRAAFFNGYHETLASLVYAGCDGFLMPSSFEPCGLGQMIAMRYGTVPIVRRTGGLADTVIDGKTGFVFDERTPENLFGAVERFCRLHQSHDQLQVFRRRIMAMDWSWRHGASEYNALYRSAIAQRATVADNIA